MKKPVFLILISLFLVLPFLAQAVECRRADGTVYQNNLNLCYPQFPGAPKLELGIKLDSLVAWFYVFIVGISGLAAFVMIVWGGMQWLTSQGSPTQTTDAKDKIKMALLGLLLVLASFLILQIINPELTLLRSP